MSLDMISWALAEETDTPVDKLVLVILGDFADQHGHASPSMQQMRWFSRTSEQSIQRSLATLEEQGRIKQVQPGTWQVRP